MNRIVMTAVLVAGLGGASAMAQQPTTPEPKGPTEPAPKSATPPATPASPPQAAKPPEGPPPLPDWFVEMDANKDGAITREEFLAVRMKLFDQLDADSKDGTLAKEEFVKLAEPPYSQDGAGVPPLDQRRRFYEGQFSQIDTNRDGKLSREEVQVFVNLNFNEFDIDRDNRITEAELRLVLQQAEERRRRLEEAQRRRSDERRQGGDMDANGNGVVELEEFLDFNSEELMELDADKDGKINLQEYMAVAGKPDENPPNMPPYEQRKQLVTARFREMDTNKDGFLVPAEMKTFLTAVFKRIDLNGDGKINQQEWQIAQSGQRPGGQQQNRKPPAAKPPAPRPGPAPAPKPAPAPGGLPPGGLLPGTGPSR
jgi:Ca2+-binding EF-hand superfamily protein